MKTTKRPNKGQLMALAVVAGLTGQLWSGQAVADYLLRDTQRALNSAPIDVDGRYSQPRPRLDQQRRELERQNEDMVQSRIEDIRIEQEKKLSESLSQAFTRGFEAAGDSVSTQQAAPKKEAPLPRATRNENVITTGFAVTNVSGDTVELESKIDTHVGFESRLNNRFAVGLNIGYMVMDITDVNPRNNPQQFNQFYNFYNGFNSFHQNQGREMDYKQLSLELNSKFYIIPDSRIQPFVGLGLGYKRSSLKYTQADNSMQFNQMFGYSGSSGFSGEEKYRANYVTANASLGTDVLFTDMVGARVMLGYSRGLTDGSRDIDTNQSLGQAFLRNVGENIAKANFFSLGAGLLISF